MVLIYVFPSFHQPHHSDHGRHTVEAPKRLAELGLGLRLGEADAADGRVAEDHLDRATGGSTGGRMEIPREC